MMEQTDTCEGHSHAVLVTALNDCIVSDRSARLGDVLDTALLRALDIVGEREESVGAESDIMSLIEPEQCHEPDRAMRASLPV